MVRKERIIRRTFQKLDEDGSGSISADELVHIPFPSALWVPDQHSCWSAKETAGSLWCVRHRWN